MAERGKEEGMKEEKDGETRKRGDLDGGVFDQAVMEPREAKDSEDGEMKQNQMKSLLCRSYPACFAGRKISPPSVITK